MAGIVTELRELGDKGISRFPAGPVDFSLYKNVHTGCGAHLPPVQWVLGDYYPGEKRTGCEANRSLRLLSRLKMALSYTSLPYMSLWRAQEIYLECLPVTRRHIPEHWRMKRVVCE